MQQLDFMTDIPLEAGYEAHRGTSNVPNQRAQQEQQGHAEWLLEVYNEVSALAGPERMEEFEARFAVFREQAKARKLSLLAVHSNLLSTLVAGGSGFDHKRAERTNSAYDNALRSYLAWVDAAAQALRAPYLPPAPPVDPLTLPTRTGEAGAVTELKAKIAAAQALQDRMKAVNAAMRKHAKKGQDAQVAAMVEAGVTEGEARALLNPRFSSRQGFEITSNGANIRRLTEQLEKAERLAATETSEYTINGVRVVDNAEEDRVQMFFPVTRVAKEVYTDLKASGFRWTPSEDCFQAFRGRKADYEAKRIAEAYPAQ